MSGRRQRARAPRAAAHPQILWAQNAATTEASIPRLLAATEADRPRLLAAPPLNERPDRPAESIVFSNPDTRQPEVQLAVWRALVTLVEAQPFLRKVLTDQGGMKLVLAGLEAHRADDAVLTQLAIGCRALLPATPPRPFVEAAGLELLVESVNARTHLALISHNLP